jgi:hypothetical protein
MTTRASSATRLGGRQPADVVSLGLRPGTG